MSAMALDKSLDEIISARPKTRRRAARGSVRAQVLGTSATGAGPSARARYSGASPASTPAVNPTVPQTSEKIIVSNLPNDVNEAQIRELFTSTVGPLKEVNLHFDHAGRSKGVASVTFLKKADGSKAYGQYNNRLIDGKRPMRIEMVLDPSRVPPPSLASRVAPAPAAGGAAPMEGVQNNARGRTGRRGRARGRGGKKGTERPAKSAADLDAEMEDYSTNPPAPATA